MLLQHDVGEHPQPLHGHWESGLVPDGAVHSRNDRPFLCVSSLSHRSQRQRARSRVPHFSHIYLTLISLAWTGKLTSPRRSDFLPAGAGYFIFKSVDNKLEQKNSAMFIAPVVLALFATADVVRVFNILSPIFH